MPNHVYITDPSNSITLTAAARAQLTPSTTKLPTSSQFPAVTIIQSASGQSVGVSGYAYGYASIAADSGYYDAGSNFFGTNVSQLTIQQITNILNSNTIPIFGAVQINLTKLNSLIANDATLYSNVTLFSPDIQSAMMCELAIQNVSQPDIYYATNILGLPGVSDSVAYYASRFSIDPIQVFTHYNSTDKTTTMGSTFSILSSEPTPVKDATIYAVVNGLTSQYGGLGLLQGFNSWSLYPSNMSGTDISGNSINSITIPGQGNNPGITNNSQNPINSIGYGLSQIGYMTQNTLQSILSTISSLTTVVSGQNVSTLNNLSTEALDALNLLPPSTHYTSRPPASNNNVITANVTLQTSYNAYQQNPNNPVLASSLNTAIADFIQANSIDNNINYSINSSFSQLNTMILPVTSTVASILNPFPPLSILQNSNALALTSTVSNTSVQGVILNTITTNASGNVNTIASGSTFPSLVTNPTLAIIAITGQSSALITPANVNVNFNFTTNT